MSDHDPLCRRAQITEVFMEGCPECAFISKVREDQSCKCKFWNGHAAGVQAAREAVAGVETYTHYPFESPGLAMDGETGVWIVRQQALAAIDALRGES